MSEKAVITLDVVEGILYIDDIQIPLDLLQEVRIDTSVDPDVPATLSLKVLVQTVFTVRDEKDILRPLGEQP